MLVALVGVACNGETTPAAPSPPPGPADPLRQIARQEGAVRVDVALAVPPEDDGTYDRDDIARIRRELLEEIGPGARVVTGYRFLPRVVLDVDARVLRRLRASPLVVGITLAEERDTAP